MHLVNTLELWMKLKDFYELPRFPINEKYGEIKRFTSITRTLPFKYKDIAPDEKVSFAK